MGDALARQANLKVQIGTSVSEIVDYLGVTEKPSKLVIGGPMMGATQIEPDSPIVRQNSGLLVLGGKSAEAPRTTACIRCDACVDSCPMRLAPIQVQRAYRAGDVRRLDELMADLCIECGTCSYVCPAKQPLAQYTRLARARLRQEQRKQKGGK
jgi:electron transport complex protein RnfC